MALLAATVCCTALLSAVATHSAEAAAIVKPTAATTGYTVGGHRTRHDGNLTVTKAGTHIDAIDLYGFLVIKAANVLVTHSIIRGGVATSGNPGLVSNTTATATNFVLQDSTVVPAHPSVQLDGVRGANYTLNRVDIYGTVDGAKVIGNNVRIQNSWIHDLVHYTHDPYQGNGPSHNDAVQVLNGRNILMTGNALKGGSNSALQITQGNGVVAGLGFTGNWVDGGACSVNVADIPLTTMSDITVSYNRFSHTSVYMNCAIIVSAGVKLSAGGNTWVGTNTGVALTWRP